MQCFSILTDHISLLLIGFAQENPYWRFLLIPSQASAGCVKGSFHLDVIFLYEPACVPGTVNEGGQLKEATR